jgi:uroporphyrinogen decarboxylase
MTPRERIIAAASRRKPDRVPKDLAWGFTPAVKDTFREKTGRNDPDDYFGVEIRFVGMDLPPAEAALEPARRRERYAAYYPDLPANADITEWGTAHLPGAFYHFTSMIAPMTRFDSLAQFETFPLPDYEDPARKAHAAGKIQAHHSRDLAVGGAMAVTIFEVAWQLRGMEELFRDFRDHPAFAECLLDRITDIRCGEARFFAEQDVDVLILGDDVSMQTGMIMSPATWRKWFKGRMKRIIDSALSVKPDLPVFYHSDGNPSAIIPELIEIGVTVLNPVQPECIDPIAVRRQYGNQLALWGTIGTQTTMPFGTPDDVRAEVRRRIETVGADGGLILGPTHSLEPDVPWENIVALYEAIEEYGRYS